MPETILSLMENAVPCKIPRGNAQSLSPEHTQEQISNLLSGNVRPGMAKSQREYRIVGVLQVVALEGGLAGIREVGQKLTVSLSRSQRIRLLGITRNVTSTIHFSGEPRGKRLHDVLKEGLGGPSNRKK